jgi:DNA recombination protein RmuC
MGLLLFFALLLLAGILMCLLVLLRRPLPAAPDFGPVVSRVEALERLLERGDRTLRDEAQRGRDEAHARMETLRASLDRQFVALREENAAKLEQMRRTVDEQLQGTLEKRLGESFRLVSDRLEQVYRGLGEMQSLASEVGDVKRALTNVRTRGIWGEVGARALLEETLAPDQFALNVAVTGGSERVEFAVKLPGTDGDGCVWLPIDAKFPMEDYLRIVEAAERGDAGEVEACSQQLYKRICECARTIRAKYVCPPRTTDFAILYLPTESLYAEVLRRPGLVENLQREYQVTVTGPTTFSAFLNSLRMGFRTLAIQQQSSEVWRVLGEVKTEFARYSDVLAKVQKKLQEASNTVDTGLTRTRAIERKLRGVEGLPAEDDEPVRRLMAAGE